MPGWKRTPRGDAPDDLIFRQWHGRFTKDGREYIIDLRRAATLRRPG